jgi:hypothetical protein
VDVLGVGAAGQGRGLRPLYAPADPADRTTYEAGEIVQCDLWFPGRVVPVAENLLADRPVLTMVAAFSGFIMAALLWSRTTGDLLAGMWQLLFGLESVGKILMWDNESGIGQHHRLTPGARSFAGTLGTRIYQSGARDPESKGVIGRASGFFETLFMPGRHLASGLQLPARRLVAGRELRGCCAGPGSNPGCGSPRT